MKHLIGISLFFLLTSFSLYAQEHETRIEPIFTLKYSPLSLLSLRTPMIQFAGENFIESNIGLQYEIGVLSDIIKPNRGYGDAFGGRLKAELRTYKHTYYYNVKVRQFWGLGIQAEQVFHNSIQYSCLPLSNCASIVAVPIREATRNLSPYLSFGSQYFITKNILVEVNLAAGITHRDNYYIIPEMFTNAGLHSGRQTFHFLFGTGINIGYAF